MSQPTLMHPTWGRPSYPPLAMLKALFLQRWYSLFDEGLEEALADRLSFQRFCGFAVDDETPDGKTVCRFRLALVAANLPGRLFAELDRSNRPHHLAQRRITYLLRHWVTCSSDHIGPDDPSPGRRSGPKMIKMEWCGCQRRLNSDPLWRVLPIES